jgi:hypothetical protein
MEAMRPRRTTLPEGTAPPASMELGEAAKRINITILESQYNELAARNVNVSGVVRELLASYLSASTIVLNVDPETRRLYEVVVGQTGVAPEAVAAELKPALSRLLDQRLQELQALRDKLR